jgi:flagellar motor switch protein FliG
MAEAVEAKVIEAGPGARRAAAVLLGLGPEVAGPVFRLMGENELRLIALGSKSMKKAGGQNVPDAVRQFVEAMGGSGVEAAAGDDLLREFATKALGNDLARRAFDGVAPPPPPDEVLGPIAQADPESLAMILSREQPQTVALVLSAIDAERAAEVMNNMPEKNRSAIVRRMATIESVAPEVLREVGAALAAELRALVAGGMRKVDGKQAALEILRRSTGAQQAEIVADIEKTDAELAGNLRTKLFTFDDLGSLSDRDLQAVLKEADSSRLTVALKGATQTLRERFMKNMSSRAAQLLADDLAAMGAVKLALVEKAQAEIAAVALSLAERERITIVRLGDKML